MQLNLKKNYTFQTPVSTGLHYSLFVHPNWKSEVEMKFYYFNFLNIYNFQLSISTIMLRYYLRRGQSLYVTDFQNLSKVGLTKMFQRPGTNPVL